jgi:acyl-CoA synthetase
MKPFLTLHHPAQARAYYEAGLWRSETFYDLLAGKAGRSPAAIALKDGRVDLTWSDLKGWVDVAAAAFAGLGLVAGDRVSIWMSNRAEAIVTFLACSRLGLACNPSLHRTYTCEETVALLKRLDAKALITEPGWGADRATCDFDSLLGGAPSLKAVYEPANFPGPAAAPATPLVSDPDAVAYLAFTSGTTGAPKCVMHSANTLLANARDLARDWSLDADARLLSLSPLSHHIAWVAVGQWLLSGCLLITDDAPPGVHKLDWLVDNKATYVMGVPTHAMDILAEKELRRLGSLGDVEVFYMAGSPIPPVVAEAFVELGVKPQNIYGMTENSSHQYTHPCDDHEIWTNTCGRGGKAYEVRIFDSDDPNKPAQPGDTGQIGGRGAALMLGYFANQDATAASFNAQGWFLSGDLGSLDADGNLKIEGRFKDLIIRGGHNIHPAHIEACALRHAGIQKAAAFPVADDRLGERVCLAILGAPDAEETLRHLAVEGLSKFDMPEYFLRMDALPLTASGKVLKRELSDMVRRGDIRPEPVRYRAQKENA